MARVSVLMGVYNNEQTVGKSIESILNQTFTDWEMIICDDGSSDNSYNVVLEYCKRDSRIKLIKNEKNQGLSYTLNKCLENATGEYSARMDGDDLCDETRFQKQVDFLDSHPEFGFVSTTMKRFDEKGVYDIPETRENYVPTLKDYIKGSPFCHAPVMIRTSAYLQVNGYRVRDEVLGVEDYDLWFRLYAKGIKGCIIREPLYNMFDGRDAAKRRTFKRRKNEYWVRKQGYKLIKAPLRYRIYALKPIIIGLIPQSLYRLFRR